MTVGCVKILFGKGFFCFPKSNQFAMKEQDLVKISWDLAQIVMDNQDGLAFLFKVWSVCMMMSSLTESIPARAHPKMTSASWTKQRAISTRWN